MYVWFDDDDDDDCVG